MVLAWQHVEPNQEYEIRTAAAPYFDPAQGALLDTLIAAPGTMTYRVDDVLGDPAANHFYLVRGLVAGAASGPSNRAGKFDFALAPGD